MRGRRKREVQLVRNLEKIKEVIKIILRLWKEVTVTNGRDKRRQIIKNRKRRKWNQETRNRYKTSKGSKVSEKKSKVIWYA